MKIKLLTALAAITVACPAFADTTPDIASNANTANCTDAVLHTTTDPTSLQAEWNPNTININWYHDADSDTPISVTNSAAGTCTYDGAITLPTNTMTKTGYTFAGWQVRAQITPISLWPDGPDTNYGCGTDGDTYYFRDFEHCRSENNSAGSSIPVVLDCSSDSAVSDLAVNEWKEIFSYGTIRGESLCSSTQPTTHLYAGNPDTSGTGDTKYCWCKTTGFDAEKDGSFVPVTSQAWVGPAGEAYADASTCARYCVERCASALKRGMGFRCAMMGRFGYD